MAFPGGAGLLTMSGSSTSCGSKSPRFSGGAFGGPSHYSGGGQPYYPGGQQPYYQGGQQPYYQGGQQPYGNGPTHYPGGSSPYMGGSSHFPGGGSSFFSSGGGGGGSSLLSGAGSSLFSSSKKTPPVCETLRINKRHAATTTIDRIDPMTGQSMPMYMVFNMSKDKVLEIRHANPHMASPDCAPLASVKFHSMSSKMDVVLRGVPFQIARPHSFSSSHSFSFQGGAEMKWKETDESQMGSGTEMFLYAPDGTKLARFKKKMKDARGVKAPGFEVYVPPQSIDMEMIICTGLACVTYKKNSDEQDAEIVGEIVGATV